MHAVRISGWGAGALGAFRSDEEDNNEVQK
jgi:hypothetical protein